MGRGGGGIQQGFLFFIVKTDKHVLVARGRISLDCLVTILWAVPSEDTLDRS